MAAPPPYSQFDGGESSSTPDQADDPRVDSHVVSPRLPALKAELLEINNKYLSAPLRGPIRPLSPDTLSNISAEEYEAIRSDRRPHDVSNTLELRLDSLDSKSGGIKARLRKSWIRNLGLVYMLVGQVFGSLMNVATRILEVEGNDGKGLHPLQILFARMGITLVISCAYMWWRKTPHFPFGQREVRWWLIARGIGGFCGVFGMYYSLLYLPIADAVVLTFLSPGIANWACSKLLNQPFTRREVIGTFVSLAGVVFIAKPVTLFAGLGGNGDTPPASGNSDSTPTNGTASAVGGPDAGDYENVTPSQRLMAVGVAMIGVLGGATAYTTIRAISTRAHPLITVNYFAAWCFIVSVGGQIFIPGIGFVLPATSKEWGYLIFLGVCGFTMQALTAAGLAYEKSSRTTNIAYTSMIFAMAADRVVFGHTPDLWSIIGSAIITTSAIVVAMQTEPERPQQTGTNTRGMNSDEESAIALMSTNEQATASLGDDLQLRALR